MPRGTISPWRFLTYKIFNILRLQAVGGVGLDVDLEDLVEFIEEIDKGGAQIGLQRVKDVAQGDLQRLGLGPVDIQVELGAAGAEGGGQVAPGRIGNWRPR